MKTFIKYKSLWIIVMLVVLIFCSCSRPEITRWLNAPVTMKIEKVSSNRLEVRWEAVEEANQYIVYKVFESGETSAIKEIMYYASQYEIARTSSPRYQYQGSYDPVENGCSAYYSCFFGVRAMDENGNMSRIKVVQVPKN